MSLIKLRTINEAYEMIKKEDEHTAVSKYLIRQLARQNKVKVMLVGTKILVDYDDLVEKINEMESYE